jgi:hypothetical protein
MLRPGLWNAAKTAAKTAAKNAATEVFTGKNPVETADKVKQAAEAIIKGATSQSEVMNRVTPQGYRTFSVPRSSPINYSPITPITYEFQPQTPVKAKPLDTELGPLLPKLPRHLQRDRISYAPTLYDPNPGNVIRSILFG